MNARAIIFDLDNTLMDRDATFRQFTEQLVEELLIELNPQQRKDWIDYIIESDADGYREKNGFFQELVDKLPWAQAMDLGKLRSFYDANYMNHARTMKHAVELLEHLKEQGYKLGLLTNGYTLLQNGKIDTLQLRRFFDQIVISEETGYRKPDERIYRIALERLGTSAEETLIIGDHPENDIWGAAQAGIRGIWLRRNHAWSDRLQGRPWQEISELDEIVTILGQEIS